jgi:hypothetical protein
VTLTPSRRHCRSDAPGGHPLSALFSQQRIGCACPSHWASSAWRAGAFVYGRREVDARVPLLGAQVGGKRGKGPAPASGGGGEGGIDE